jgi:membrane glycosyltransferase
MATADIGHSLPFSRLPAKQPLAMPPQNLHTWPKTNRALVATGPTLAARVFVVIVMLALTAGLTWGLWRVLVPGPWTLSTAILMVAGSLCFTWISLGSANAVLGALKIISGRVDPIEIRETFVLNSRTALLFPIYHEDPCSIANTIETIGRALVMRGYRFNFDIFVLSDSHDSTAHRQERAALEQMDGTCGYAIPVYYRVRATNEGKKAGNIASWVKNHGAAYDHFIIFDADSVMTASALSRLVGAMERHPAVGLIQTVPQLVGARTVFGRLQQFAQACYGPLVATGYAAWQGNGGNYWGHNAIIRTKAFAQAAGLPVLPGRAPLGGAIRSHDFVEAALLTRAGWDVYLAPSIVESYEGCPPTVRDLAVRDRRWAQGNLQHIKVVGAAGLTTVSRIHLTLGILAYLTSAFWAISLVAGLVVTFQTQWVVPRYFPSTPTLFPIWPTYDSAAALYLLIATAAVLLLPKLSGLAIVLMQTKAGVGRLKLCGGFFLEALVSMLMAPVMMTLQVQAVCETLIGRDSGWSVQSRSAVAISWREALQFHSWHVMLGGLIAIACICVSWQVLAWMSPIVLGLILAPLLTVWTSVDAPWATAILNGPPTVSSATEGSADAVMANSRSTGNPINADRRRRQPTLAVS